MIRRLGLATVLFALATALDGAVAEDMKSAPPLQRSAMFTAAEIGQVLGAIRESSTPHATVAQTAPGEPAKPVVANIYISAVADYGSGRWTVWANGHRIMPGRPVPGFQVLSVRDDRVDILVEGDAPARVTLRPHQTWLSESNDVVEGIIP